MSKKKIVGNNVRFNTRITDSTCSVNPWRTMAWCKHTFIISFRCHNHRLIQSNPLLHL
ncbi:hypothetical protein LINPERPRIM_LOCUS7403 [Linum perenne]